MTATGALTLRRLDRAAVQPHLESLNAWLLPASFYGVQHTWPQLYRSDGDGRFLGLFADGQLLSHCAWRLADLRTGDGLFRVALLGSVATAPPARGQGHASRLLRAALDDCRRQGAAAALLWAERPDLYVRLGFAAGPPETCLLLAPATGGPAPAAGEPGTARPATIRDHAALLSLHARKPLGVVRDQHTMSLLLTTPGLATWVLERHDRVVAYACHGKGADLQQWWHELGGEDDDVARLLALAVAAAPAAATAVLVPPYRPLLADLLAPWCRERAAVAGPMHCASTTALRPPLWIDGLDSV